MISGSSHSRLLRGHSDEDKPHAAHNNIAQNMGEDIRTERAWPGSHVKLGTILGTIAAEYPHKP
jgi:hypothetical protein